MSDKTKYVTPEYLLNHGFVRYNNKSEEWLPYHAPFQNNEDLHFVEKSFDRNMFVVIFSVDYEDKNWMHHSIFVQEDAGCEFVCIPERWAELPIEYFESIYYGIRGEKPKYQPYAEDAEYKLIEPKQLPEP